MTENKIIIDLEKFVLFHKKRVSLLNEFVKKKEHGRLIFQISFLGFESLAKLMYPKETSSKRRFIELLSLIQIRKEEAKELHDDWRNSLIHQGFIAYPWTTLEGWDEDDESFLIFPDGLKSSTEYPPGSILAMYNRLIDIIHEHFREQNIIKIVFTD